MEFMKSATHGIKTETADRCGFRGEGEEKLCQTRVQFG